MTFPEDAAVEGGWAEVERKEQKEKKTARKVLKVSRES